MAHAKIVFCPRRASNAPITCHPAGPVAQLAEQQTLNLRVVGSIPTRLTTINLNNHKHLLQRQQNGAIS
jgi:hypothetical protein